MVYFDGADEDWSPQCLNVGFDENRDISIVRIDEESGKAVGAGHERRTWASMAKKLSMHMVVDAASPHSVFDITVQ